MSEYKTILAAVDLTEEAADVLAAARQSAAEKQAQLHVVTAIRPLSFAYAGYEMPGMSQALVDFEPLASKQANEQLATLTKDMGVSESQIHVEFGKPSTVIKSIAEQIEADLIIMGSHGRHGLGLLLGSTANAVLHGAPCDVLTLRIQPSPHLKKDN